MIGVISPPRWDKIISPRPRQPGTEDHYHDYDDHKDHGDGDNDDDNDDNDDLSCMVGQDHQIGHVTMMTMMIPKGEQDHQSKIQAAQYGSS